MDYISRSYNPLFKQNDAGLIELTRTINAYDSGSWRSHDSDGLDKQIT